MLTIPTIGIGAGRYTDGQILVWTDLLGLNTGRLPKFVTEYLSLATEMGAAVTTWRDDVRRGAFPTAENVFTDD